MALGPDITPELAQKGLEADARNMLTNVVHGDTLSPGKRQLLLTSLLTAASPEELREARISSILLKYTQGKRLSKDELEEVAHLLPVETAAYSKKTTEDTYSKPYKEYVPIYGKQERTIKWWVGQGKSAEGGPDLPPLDRPEEMPQWWTRCMKQKCPASVLDAARGASGKSTPDRSTPEKPSASPAPKASLPPPRYEPALVSTQEQSLQHLKEQLTRARQDLLEEQSKEELDTHKVEAKERKWRELRKEVDAAEEAVFKMRTKQGKLVDLEELGAQLLPMLVTTAESFRSLLTRLKPRLSAAQNDAERDTIWQSGVDECFTELIAAGFISRENLSLS